MMNQQERDVLAKKLNFLLKIYEKQNLSANYITQYMDALDQFYNRKLNEYLFALDEYSKNKFNKTFPTPIQLRPYLDVEPESISIANDLSRVIKSLTGKRGYNWNQGRYFDGELSIYEGKDQNFWTFKEAVMSEVGILGWEVIKKYGGWAYVCQDANENQNFIPQMREFIKSTIEFQKNDISIENIQITSNNEKLKLEEKRNEIKKYIQMKEIY